ncbi:relaxase/mobilization nuclease and DUF3363 domain-containing protein [Pinisolibacter sp. B13]|nr:relaxase/mobilization nuclease and DUF3363 domain-containing protein [Pinisolibacter aquiterrae]MCC8235751.1 DUF3363 domain-containing protein [Pinisolibacter aquiterrae]
MNRDDEHRLRPKPGRVGRGGDGKATASFFTKVGKVARQHGMGGSSGSSIGPGVTSPASRLGGAAGRGVARGRGAAFVRACDLGRGWSHRRPGARRVVVKARFVRAAGQGGRTAAHLRYLQRDGTSRDGERGQLYAAGEDRADGEAFLARGHDDRHQFRFIVAPEDGAALGDLSGFTRDLMAEVENDLGTRLDWVAVNHFNTGHPHVHVVVNGRDEWGEDLIINGDYIAHGVRERASELVTLELGPVTEIERQQRLAAELDQDRFTRIDRALIEESQEGLLDLRHAPADQREIADRASRLGRLKKLERMGLATEAAPGTWSLSDRLEPTLRQLGERGDIVATLQRALSAEGMERDPASFQIHDGVPASPIVGRLLGKHLPDELGDGVAVIVDGIDGRLHHVSGFDPARLEEVAIDAIIEVGPREAGPRPADRTIAASVEDGTYRPSRHLEQARFEGAVPRGDPEGFVEAHVRRLEALRRAGIVERIDADHWRIPQDFESRAAAHDAGRSRQATIRTLSTLDLEAQISADGATWLDRRLIGRNPSDLVPSGFGHVVDRAMGHRRERLIEQGDAVRRSDGRIAYRRDLLTTLETREVARVGSELALERPVPFRASVDGETVQGTFQRTVPLASGRYALVENAKEFTLVPWRPVIGDRLGREVMGIVQGTSISWQLGKTRGLGI